MNFEERFQQLTGKTPYTPEPRVLSPPALNVFACLFEGRFTPYRYMAYLELAALGAMVELQAQP